MSKSKTEATRYDHDEDEPGIPVVVRPKGVGVAALFVDWYEPSQTPILFVRGDVFEDWDDVEGLRAIFARADPAASPQLAPISSPTTCPRPDVVGGGS
jgi:hypothetical protein